MTTTWSKGNDAFFGAAKNHCVRNDFMLVLLLLLTDLLPSSLGEAPLGQFCYFLCRDCFNLAIMAAGSKWNITIFGTATNHCVLNSFILMLLL